jgi:hypothetical protein
MMIVSLKPLGQRTARHELHIAMSSDVETALRQILLPPTPRQRERGVIGLLHQSNGGHRRTLLLHSVVQPLLGDVTFSAEGLLFAASYKSRATDAATILGAGLIFIHTHPSAPASTATPGPSGPDLEADARDLYTLGAALKAGAPLAAGIVTDSGVWSAREYTFRFPRTAQQARTRSFGWRSGTTRPVTAVRIVGPRLQKLPTGTRADGPGGADGAIDRAAQDSSVRLWGEVGQRILATLRVGLAGAGGVGSILAEHLARLGVGELVIVDFDRLGSDVTNRARGATRRDAASRRYKVDIATRVARAAATAPGFQAAAIRGSVVETETIPHLLDCDLIVNAADSPWARQVLDHLAFAHLIPVIHGGTSLVGDSETGRLQSGKSEVSATGPGQPCSECANVYSVRDVTEAQEGPEMRGQRRYVQGGDPTLIEELRAPSVIAFNALVAGLMQLRLLAITVGTTPEAVRGTQRYHALSGTLEWGAIEECRLDCDRRSITALGDTYALPTGRDMDKAAQAGAEPVDLMATNNSA